MDLFPSGQSGLYMKVCIILAGPYTVIDKLSEVTYTVQLIGGTQILMIPRNRMKPCLAPPALQTDIVTVRHSQTTLDCVLTYADVAVGQPMPQVRVYTSVKSDHPTTRLTRTHRPPSRYDDYLHY